MIPELPEYLNLTFVLITLLTVYLLTRAARFTKVVPGIALLLMLVQGMAGLNGFYTDTGAVPPRFPLLVMPAFALIILAFFSHSGRQLLNQLSLRGLTWIHVVRLPVEFVLHALYMQDQIPGIMTFEGWNFDIISGISAPVLAILGFENGAPKKKLLLLWNVFCLMLLLNIVVLSVLASPVPFQQLAFEQPNRAVQYFPFVWLPAVIVPIVLFAHLSSLRLLVQQPAQ